MPGAAPIVVISHTLWKRRYGADSGIVGQEKPHPAIFEAALRSMKADAADSLYVGDIYSIDYVGARNAGMQAILFDVAGAYRESEFPRVESLAGLQNWLRIQ